MILDRYILRLALGWYFGIVGTVVLLLSIETFPGLLDKLSGIKDPTAVVFRSIVSLIPEYVGVALPLAVFFATALAFRRLALGGELDALAASGLSMSRMLRTPLLLGLVTCLLLIGVRGYAQPAGERRLDSIGRSVSAGDFGVALRARISNRLAPDTRLYFDRVNPGSDRLDGIVINKGGTTMFARSARLVPTTDDRVILALRDGMINWVGSDGSPHVVRFDVFRLAVPAAVRTPHKVKSPRDRLERFDLDQLIPFAARGQPDLTAPMGAASAAARVATALFCLILPLFGFAFGVPPKRSRSAIGLGAGVVIVILFWRISALIEDRFTTIALVAHAVLVAAFVAAAIHLTRIQQREGFGAVELWLAGVVDAVRRRLPRIRSARRGVQTIEAGAGSPASVFVQE